LQYLDLADFLAIGCDVSGVELATVAKIDDLGLSDSAPTPRWLASQESSCTRPFIDRAAMLSSDSRRTIPCPDGNKRCAWVSLRLFVERNGWDWDPYPSVDDAEAAVVAAVAGESKWRLRTARCHSAHAPPSLVMATTRLYPLLLDAHPRR
jgi:prophage maintenance system killer protein